MEGLLAVATTALVALTAAICATVVAPARASAECSSEAAWPLFQYAAPRADRIVIATVTAVEGGDDPGRDLYLPDVTIRVDDRVRGRSPDSIILGKPQSAGDSCLPGGLRARVGDRIAVAWGPQAGSHVGVLGPVSAIAYVGPTGSRTALARQGAYSGMQQLTPANVRQLARLPAHDLAFFAADDGRHGRELWRTDGTKQGTRLVADIAPGEASSAPDGLVSAMGRLYFSADDGVHGREPWISDGTRAGTRMLRDVRAGAAGSDPSDMVAINDQASFSADDGAHGREPWGSDGTPGGTRLTLDVRPGPEDSDPTGMTLVNGAVFFGADDGVHGRELWTTRDWRLDAEGPGILQDVRPGPQGSDPADFLEFAGSGLFTADDGVHGRQLWLDGRMMAAVRPVDPDPRDLLLVHDGEGFPTRLFYSATDTDGGRRLYGSPVTGTEEGSPELRTPVALSDPRPAPDTDPWLLTVLGRRVFFAPPVEGRGPHLWVTEGTPESTYAVTDTGGLFIGSMASSPDRLAFTTTGIGSQGAVWGGDGTIDGTKPSGDETAPTAPAAISRLGDIFLFTGELPQQGREPWALTGTGQGVSRPLRDIRPGPVGSDPSGFVWLRITSVGP